MLIPLLFLFSYPAPSFEIKDGDRIVMVGSAIIEREQQYGYIELMLHRLYKDKKFTVRNLGWSGDTVWGEARAGFGTQADGYRTLVEQVKACKPTVLIIGYGTSEAFAGKAGLENFVKQFRQFLSDVATPERLVFLTIPRNLTAERKSSTSQMEYNEAIKSLAAALKGILVDIFHLFQAYDTEELSEGGYLPNADGYKKMAFMMLVAFSETIQNGGKQKSMNWPSLKHSELEPLRQLIVSKNELYFHHYRPQNNTYLFLFRKHEQGNNAKEIPQFEPLIAELDKQINEMKGKLPPK